MTVCVAVQVNECLVFAADSATTLTDMHPTGAPVVNVFDHGHKVFNIYKGLPVGAMTCGLGNIGHASISLLSKELRRLLTDGERKWKINPKRYTIEEIANRARAFLYEERFAQLPIKPMSPMEFYIGGYSSDSEQHELWKVVIADPDAGAPICSSPAGETGITWAGQPEAINRLVLGVSSGLESGLISAGLTPPQAQALVNHVAAQSTAQLAWPAMPVQDAIALADFLVETTKRFVRFLPGADTVGGDTDIAVITKFEGFKWVRRKHYFPAHLNPERG